MMMICHPDRHGDAAPDFKRDLKAATAVLTNAKLHRDLGQWGQASAAPP
eukprot:gene4155-5893_t